MFKSLIANIAVAGFVLGISSLAADEDQQMSGEIQSVAKDHIVLKVESEVHRVSTTSATQVTLDGEKASLADLKAGFKAEVTAKRSDDQQYAATKIVATSTSTFLISALEEEKKQAQKYEGTIQKVEKTSLQITNEEQEQMTFEVATQTVVKLNGKRASLTDLKAGFQVEITTVVKDGKRMAKVIDATSAAY